jgi:PKD repeat protein
VTCSFDASPSSDPDGSVAAYAWTFGDGTAGSGVSATHAYAHAGPFTVTLLVTDNLGGTGAKSQTVTAVNAAPVASFTASCTHVTCSLNASASSDPDGAVAGYAWTFGDGTTGAGLTATHAYAAAGSFLVTLVVTDNLGATGSASRTVTAVNAPPVASFTSSCTNLSCSFNGSASSDSDGSIAAYAWTFGDGSAASGATASHAYAAAGTYAVVLTVTDDLGATATRSASVTVTALIHVGDLDGRASISGSTWSASVTVTVHSSSHALVGGATVKGSWTGGTTASCTTAATGQCTVLRSAIPGSTKTVTFTVSALSHPAMTYSPAANHDPDGDSDGTSIVVSRR